MRLRKLGPHILGASALAASLVGAGAAARADEPLPPPPPPPPPSGQPYPYPPPPYYAPPGYPPQPYYAPQPAAPPRPEKPYVIYDWDPDVPPPAGYRMVEHANGKLVGVGIGLLAAGWVTSAFVAIMATSDNRSKADKWTPLYVPVAGPFIGLGTLDPKPSGTGMLIADGVLQAGGVLAIVIGVLDERHKLVRTDETRALSITPLAGATSAGLGAKGQF